MTWVVVLALLGLACLVYAGGELVRYLWRRWLTRRHLRTCPMVQVDEHYEQALALAAPDPLELVPVGSALVHRACRDERTAGRATFMCAACSDLLRPRSRQERAS